MPLRISISRSTGTDHEDYLQADGWAVTGNSPRSPARPGDLSRFGEARTNSSSSMSPLEYKGNLLAISTILAG